MHNVVENVLANPERRPATRLQAKVAAHNKA